MNHAGGWREEAQEQVYSELLGRLGEDCEISHGFELEKELFQDMGG